MLSRSRLISITAVIIVLLPAVVFADVEYYTWGGFDPVSAAFKRSALIFNANGYKTFVAAMGILGILVVGLNLFLNTAFQRPSTGLAMFAPVIAGAVIYSGLFVPTENVVIYDTVLNQNITVAGVPQGVAKPAWIVNSIERFIIDMLDNNPSALGEPRYQDVGIKGWDAAASTTAAVVSSSAASQTLARYIKDCAVFEMARPGGSLSTDMLSCTPAGQSFIQTLGAAKNPAIYTVAYIDNTGGSIPSGESCTCDDSHTRFSTFYANSANSAKDLANACAAQGFADAAQCQTVVGNILSQLQPLTNGPADANNALALNVAAQVTTNTLVNAGTDSAASVTVLTGEADKGKKGGVVSGIINPRMIDAYIAYAVVLTPVLLLLVVTPMSFRVLGFVVGLYLWVMLARVADVICYHNWAAEVLRTAPSLTCNINGAAGGAGLEYQYGALSFLQSHLGSLADMRSSVFLLATMISGALFKFSDSAVSRLADRGDQVANQGLAGAGGYSQKGFATQQASDTVTNAAKQGLIGGEAWTNIGKGAAAGAIMDGYDKLGKGGASGGAGGIAATSLQNGSSQALESNSFNSRNDLQAVGAGVNRREAERHEQKVKGVDGVLAGAAAEHAANKEIGVMKGTESALGGPGEVQGGMAETAFKETTDRLAVAKAANNLAGGDRRLQQQQAQVTATVNEQGKILTALKDTSAQGSAESAAAARATVASAKTADDLNKVNAEWKRLDEAAKHNASMKDNPAFWADKDKTHLNDLGRAFAQNEYFTSANQIKGADVGEVAAMGAYSKTPDASGGVTYAGRISSRDQANAAIAYLRNHGGGSDAVRALQRLSSARDFKGGDFSLSTNKEGRITGFDMKGGSSVEFNNKGSFNSGVKTDINNSYKNDSSSITDASVKNIADTIFSRRNISENYASRTYVDPKTGEKIQEMGYMANGAFRSVLGVAESTKAGQGHSQSYFVNTRNGRVAVAGTQDGQMLLKGIDGNGAINAVINPATGESVFTDIRSGKTTSVHLDDTKIAQGTQVSGAANYAVGKVASTMGADQKTAEQWVGTVQSVVKDVVPIAKAGVRSGIKKSRDNTSDNTANTPGAESKPTIPGYEKY